MSTRLGAAPRLTIALAVACTHAPATHTPSTRPPGRTALGPAASACAVDFDSTYAIITRDYAGYEDRMRESAARVAALADSVRAAVRTVASDSACTATIQRWTTIFGEHDHHLQL